MIKNIIIELGLIEICQLKSLLGYKDSRAVKSWCDKKGLKIQVLGKKNYIKRRELENLLSSSGNHADTGNCNQPGLADQNQGLAGKSNQSNTNGHSFATKNDTPLKSLVQKYKTKIR